MSKKIRNCFYESLTFNKLLEAHYRARKQKTYKKELVEFEMNLENNLVNLENNIRNHRYHLGQYREFKIYEPKERIIKALPYPDRIVHQWYVEEFIKPYFIPRLISTTFACIEDRGTHAATEQVQRYMQIAKRNYGDFWILKCDIKKYFYNIDPHILLKILSRSIEDSALLDFTKLLIFESRKPDENLGIPIGNYTSQYFANIYLNELDQYVKRKLHVKYYVRYMDDFVLILRSKKECIEMKKKIEEFLWDNLRLELNDKTRYYPYKMGVNFCGYRIYCTHRLLRTNSKKKIKKQVKKWNYLYSHNKLDFNFTMQSLNSWLGHASHCNSYNLQNKVLDSCEFLYNNLATDSIERELAKDIENHLKSSVRTVKIDEED